MAGVEELGVGIRLKANECQSSLIPGQIPSSDGSHLVRSAVNKRSEFN